MECWLLRGVGDALYIRNAAVLKISGGPPHLLWPLLKARNAKVLHDQTKSLSENHIYKNVFLCCWNRISWAGKNKVEAVLGHQNQPERMWNEGISCRGSFSYHRGQPDSEEESIEVKLFSKQATLQVPSGCLIKQMLCIHRPSFIIVPTLFICGLCGTCPAFSSAVWKCWHS